MTSKRAKILLFFIACTLQKVVAQSLDSLPYTLTVGDDVLGMELRSEQEAKQSMYILSRSEGNADQSMLSSTLITNEEVEMSGPLACLRCCDFRLRCLFSNVHTVIIRFVYVSTPLQSGHQTILRPVFL